MGAIAFFAFILFVMGGVTAYMGDRLGSYIGKKRHSTFGLRPRHTAMLWTVVSGGVIAVGTLLLFVALNNTFKTALIHGEQLLAANRDLTGRNQALLRRNAAEARQADFDEQLARAAQAKAADAQKTLAVMRGKLGATKAILTQSRSVLAQSRTVLAQRQAALASAQQTLLEAQHGLGNTRASLRDAQAQVRQARAGVQEARREAQVAGTEMVQANKTVLALVIKQDALASKNKVQESLLQESQGRALIFRREEELGRTIVSARQDPDALRRELSVFLDQVELTARQRGAGGVDNAPAIIVPAFSEASGNNAAAREAALDALSQNIAAEGGFMPSIVVVADARYNTFRGEPVKLDLRPYGNILVFNKGAVIAHGTVDGSKPEDMILKQLQTFLTDQVRTTALERGIIPMHDPQSGAPLVGQPIKSEDWVGLVKQIQQAGPDAKITASAAQDTYSGDQLHLEFHVAGS